MNDPTTPVLLTQREIKGLRVALIFGVPDDANENAPELISAITKLREANEPRSVSDKDREPGRSIGEVPVNADTKLREPLPAEPGEDPGPVSDNPEDRT